MHKSLELFAGPMHCTLRPDLGGCVSGLWYDGVPVLRSAAPQALTSVRQSACYPLLPYSNRIGQALLPWQGRTYVLGRNFPPEPHALHGVGWQRAWQVQQHGPHSATLVYAHAGDADWPFAFDAQQQLVLHADSLEVSLQLCNQAPHAVPVGLGWHPYFTKRPDSNVALEVSGRWEMGEDKLPTHLQPHEALQGGCHRWQLDHCFEGWDGVVHLHDAHMQVRLQSDLRRMVVFTDPTRDFIALEPVSHVNNAAQLAQNLNCSLADVGLVALQPGHSLTASMCIHVQTAK